MIFREVRQGLMCKGCIDNRMHDLLEPDVDRQFGALDRTGRPVGETLRQLIDTYGGGYVDMAIGMGVSPDRIDTII